MAKDSIVSIKLNRNMIVNTFIGLSVALVFDDLRELFINEIILKIVNRNIPKKKIKVEKLDVTLNYEKIIDLAINIFITFLFIFIIYYNT